MADNRKKVLIFGAGPAGLATGIHLLEKAGPENLDVTIVNLDHHLGGKAKSWRDRHFNDGRFYDHGFHFVFGFYKNLRKLMAKAGIREEDVLISNHGYLYWYEMRDKSLHTIRYSPFKPLSLMMLASYGGLTLTEKINIGFWGMRNFNEIFLEKDISYLDDICFKAWVIENGLRPDFAKTSTLFRFTQDALFNWPYEISAYASLAAVRKMFTVGRNPFSAFSYKNLEVFIVNDGWSSQLWDPMGEYYKSLGGKFDFGKKLVGLQHDNHRLTAVEIGQTGHDDRRSAVIPIVPGSKQVVSDFDYVISTIPMNNFRELNAEDDTMWRHPYFNNMYNLTGIAPIGMWAFFKEDIGFPFKGQINGIEPPLFNAIDYKPFCLPYKNNPHFGTVIHMQGQETAFEHLSDREVVELGLNYLCRLKGFEKLPSATLEHYFLFRGNRNHSRYLLTDPGTYKFRPTVKSPFEKLYLAGDWLQNEYVIPCMEGAIQTGWQAADYVLEDSGLAAAKTT